MGNSESNIKKVNFDDIITSKNTHIIINVMEKHEQEILIKGTLSINEEIETINSLLALGKMDTTIIIYGKNTDDISKVISRYRQLQNMGFTNPRAYIGGLFEWLLLQEMYGCDEFKTNTTCKNSILDYKPDRGI
jgi:hypothetical protein